MVKALTLIVKEEEQLVLDYRTADSTSEHVPPQFVLRYLIGALEPMFPLVRI